MVELETLRERLARWRERAALARTKGQRAEWENVARQYEALLNGVQSTSRTSDTRS